MKEIYLAGGCFWGVDAYFQRIDGIVETESGYANGNTENPTYEEVCRMNTGFAEAVKLIYDETVIALPEVLQRYFKIIDPTTIDRQGGDTGNQYRTGIYFVDPSDEVVIKDQLDQLAKKYEDKIQVEVMPLQNYYKAEEYHQDYLKKNPRGYCHINLALADEPLA